MKKRKRYYRLLGFSLIIISLLIFARVLFDPLMAEIRFYFDQFLGKTYVVEGDQNLSQAGPIFRDLTGDKPMNGFDQMAPNVEILRAPDPNFSIVIPKIAASAVVSANVDTTDENNYLQVLKSSVAHALGTNFPGSGEHIFLFAHSTDYFWRVGQYNAVFYLLYKLVPSDEINLFFAGKRYKYTVTDSKIVEPHEVEYLTRNSTGEELTLQTCWPPGTTLKRLLVFAKPAK